MFGLIRTSLVLRRISDSERNIFLTFDDGPIADFTPTVLDILGEAGVAGSFFVIGSRAKKHPELLRRMQAEGHAIFSHSSDHNYFQYFRTPMFLKRWVVESLRELEQLTGSEQKIFRPPGGYVPPPLFWAARSLGVPLVLWNHRFYDWVHEWNPEDAAASSRRANPGDIVLLHDEQRPTNRAQFVRTLRSYIADLKAKGLNPMPLSNELALRQMNQSAERLEPQRMYQ